MSFPDAATVAELVRLPAVLSVPGDAWAGAAAARSRAGWAMPLASGLIYLGGMALNDWADRDLDALERPERPIPSGRVEADTALAIGAGMVAAGVVTAGVLGGRSALRIAVPLAGAVWTYDVAAKDTAAGPAAMATCRALDVLLGAASGDLAAAAPAAALIGAHTLIVTEVSRHEVHGATRDVPQRALAGTGVVAGLAAVLGLRGRSVRPLALAAAAGYAAQVGGGYAEAAENPEDPMAIRAAVGKGVMGVVGLQSSLIAGAGAAFAAGLVAAVVPIGRALRKKSVT